MKIRLLSICCILLIIAGGGCAEKSGTIKNKKQAKETPNKKGEQSSAEKQSGAK